MDRRALYLDVDGVINAFTLKGHDPNDSYDFDVHPEVDGRTLRTSRQMLADLAATGAEVAWLTTWLAKAPSLVAPLVGAPAWPWIDWSPMKVDGVVTDQAARGVRPFVWIDDDEATAGVIPHLTRAFADADLDVPPCLLVSPRPRRALTPSQVARIAAWCAEPDDAKTPGHITLLP